MGAPQGYFRISLDEFIAARADDAASAGLPVAGLATRMMVQRRQKQLTKGVLPTVIFRGFFTEILRLSWAWRCD